MGTIRDSLSNARTMPATHNAALDPGDEVVRNGQLLVAVNTTALNVENVFVYRGKVEFAKKAALILDAGVVAYWDADNSEITNDPAGNTKAGMVVEDAAAADTVVLVMLGENR